MLQSIREQYSELSEGITTSKHSDPNERNAGITPAESAIAFVAALGATFVAREILEATWRTTLDRDPPKNPASSEVEWKEAIMWGAVSGGRGRHRTNRFETI